MKRLEIEILSCTEQPTDYPEYRGSDGKPAVVTLWACQYAGEPPEHSLYGRLINSSQETAGVILGYWKSKRAVMLDRPCVPGVYEVTPGKTIDDVKQRWLF